MLEELDAAFTEAIFNYRWSLLTDYHAIGKTLLKGKLNIEKVALACRQRPKLVHYCKELARLYPNLNSLPDGKTISWHKACKLLPKYEKKLTTKAKRIQA